jgi:hypothetical protein
MDFLKNPLFLIAIYATACYVLTFITRRIVETAHPDWKKQHDENDKKVTYSSKGARWWNGVILYTIGPSFGVVLALILRKSEYFPEDFKTSVTGAVVFGLVCGFTCSWFFKIFKKLLSRAAKVEEKELDETPDTPDVPGGE